MVNAAIDDSQCGEARVGTRSGESLTVVSRRLGPWVSMVCRAAARSGMTQAYRLVKVGAQGSSEQSRSRWTKFRQNRNSTRQKEIRQAALVTDQKAADFTTDGGVGKFAVSLEMSHGASCQESRALTGVR